MSPLSTGSGEVLYSLGNLNVVRMLRVWGSPLLDRLPPATEENFRADIHGYIERCKQLGIDALEDYIGWGVVEVEPDRWDFTPHLAVAEAAHAAGLAYIPFCCVWCLPPWVRDDSVNYPRATCVEHGRPTELLSNFAAATERVYDRFYAQLQAVMGETIDLIRFASPTDYGEVTYPTGAANWAFPQPHIHEGFWAGEAPAYAHFRAAMERTYNADLDALNRSWATEFGSFADLTYPADDAPDRYRYDFASWYADALTERTFVLVDVARSHTGDTPMLVSTGHPAERVVLGHDLAGLTREAARRGVQMRTGTGPWVSFFNVKRSATAAAWYGLDGFSSEPADDTSASEAIALALFKDLEGGFTWHFDYGGNYERLPEAFAAARPRFAAVGERLVDAALFFPTTHQRLMRQELVADSQSGENEFPGYPDGLVSFGESLRQVCDYDVVDERLVQDGVLSRYRLLLWPFGDVARRPTLERVLQWVRDGGVLLISDAATVRCLEDETRPFVEDGRAKGCTALGDGFIVDVEPGSIGTTGWRSDLMQCRAAYNPKASPGFAAWVEQVRQTGDTATRLRDAAAMLTPPIDQEGVLVTRFVNGRVLHNATDHEVRVLSSGGSESVIGPLGLDWQPA